MTDWSYVQKWGPTHLTTDIVVLIKTCDGEYLVAVTRKNAQHEFALPGGFVDMKETVHDGAIRELLEETSIDAGLEDTSPYWDVRRFSLLFDDDTPDRDPRARMKTHVFGCVVRTQYNAFAVTNLLDQADKDPEIDSIDLIHADGLLAISSRNWRYDHEDIVLRALPLLRKL